jgi:hypothetical protein
MLMNAIPFDQRISCTVDEACLVSGLGRTKIYEEISAGRIETKKIGKRTLVVVKSLLKRFGNEETISGQAA